MIPLEKLSINKFWEKTPTVLKYILIFAIFIIVLYFLFSKRLDTNSTKEIDTLKEGIAVTYELIDNFEEFRIEQNTYNQEILEYLQNLHSLAENLNNTTNRKLDMILSSDDQNIEHIIEKIILLNESFEKLSEAYQKNIEIPNLKDNKVVRKEYNYRPIIVAKPMDKNTREKK